MALSAELALQETMDRLQNNDDVYNDGYDP
jgi:hypothetical protein